MFPEYSISSVLSSSFNSNFTLKPFKSEDIFTTVFNVLLPVNQLEPSKEVGSTSTINRSPSITGSPIILNSGIVTTTSFNVIGFRLSYLRGSGLPVIIFHIILSYIFLRFLEKSLINSGFIKTSSLD